MRKLYFTSILLGMVLASTSCEDDNKGYTDEFATVLNYKQEGIVEFDFYNVNKDVTQIVTVGKGGHDLAAQPEITLIPFTQEEMDDYNKSTGSTFKLLPAEYYTLPTELTFAAEELYKNIDVVFKATVGELAKASDYLLPIRLLSNTSPVHGNKNLICLKPNVLTPSLSLKEPGKMDVTLSKEEEPVKIVDLSYYLDLKNEWDFTIKFEKDEVALAAAVMAYNKKNGVDYKLLPQGNRTFASSLPFTANVRNAKLEITFSHEGLELGHYLLPVIPAECVGMPFDISKGACYIHVMITEQLPKIQVSESMITASDHYSDVCTPKELVDGVLSGTNRHWHSSWTRESQKHDPLYGVYIDITLTKAISDRMAIKYWTRADMANAVPAYIDIYVGDKTEPSKLTKIGTLTRTADGLPTAKATSYESKNFSLNGVSATFIRLAITKAYTGSTETNLKEANNGASVAMAELNLHGK